ncbi:MAG TPA: hypothetical protein VJ721_00225 [Chthoniobacterales bacterium]|nr:hypothetical protein [Chthoniobacterales bacterium]
MNLRPPSVLQIIGAKSSRTAEAGIDGPGISALVGGKPHGKNLAGHQGQDRANHPTVLGGQDLAPTVIATGHPAGVMRTKDAANTEDASIPGRWISRCLPSSSNFHRARRRLKT